MLDFIATPLGYIMKFCYNITHNYAIALILFTLFFKLLLLPLNIKQQKSQQAQARIRPKEMAIRKRYAGRTDQNATIELSNDLSKLYKSENVSLTGGCLTTLIQLPIIIVLWNIIQQPLRYLCMFSKQAVADLSAKMVELNYIAKNATEIEMIKVLGEHRADFDPILSGYGYTDFVPPDFTLFGGAIDLSAVPTLAFNLLLIFPFLTALLQFLSTLVIQHFSFQPDTSSPETASTAKTMKIMNLIFPVMTIFFGFSLPAIISLYWIYQTIISTIITVILAKVYPMPVYTEEEILAIEQEMNKDYVVPVQNTAPAHHRSLHYIDADDDELPSVDGEKDIDDETDTDDESTEEQVFVKPEEIPDIPRRKYDKNGNKIHSLHYIDEDDDIPESIPEKAEHSNSDITENNDSTEKINNDGEETK